MLAVLVGPLEYPPSYRVEAILVEVEAVPCPFPWAGGVSAMVMQ